MLGLDVGRAVVDPGPGQRVETVGGQSPVSHSAGHDHGFGGDRRTVLHVDDLEGVLALDRGDRRRDEDLGAEPLGSQASFVLARFEDAPDLLFVRGAFPSEPGVAVVGTRKCTTYGREVAEAYGRAIAESGWVLVSGLARGIDGCAHRGTVAAGGVGVAVLGCGLDVAYPREHRRLGEELVSLGGGIVSEYAPGTRPDGWRFPLRNRIIAMLCRAVVVVEAAARSVEEPTREKFEGVVQRALITATRNGRDEARGKLVGDNARHEHE